MIIPPDQADIEADFLHSWDGRCIQTPSDASMEETYRRHRSTATVLVARPPPPPPCVGDARLETPSRGVRYLLVLLIACDTVMPLDREIW